VSARPASPSGRADPALVLVLAGVSAALHVGKLPPALPVLGEVLGLSLLQSGFLLSMVQLAGVLLGLAVGLAADGVGLRRTLISGLLVLSVAGALGGWAQSAPVLIALRGLEGLGFLLVAMPAPALLRRLVQAHRLSAVLGVWGSYMPLGMALALLFGPLVLAQSGWQTWWWLTACLTGIMAVWVWHALPPDPEAGAAIRLAKGAVGAASKQHDGARARLGRTLRAPGPWLVALCFAVYSGQWLAVIGFLPSIYAQAHVSAASGALLTALAALVNISGNLAAGRLLQRGWPASLLLQTGFCAMTLGAFGAFSGSSVMGAAAAPTLLPFLSVLLFSAVGGMVPATLFSLAVRLAPDTQTVSTTVGWMQQWSSLGQFVGPPLVAALAAAVGGWHWSWLLTGACSVAGLLLAALMGRLLQSRS
jgi:CP family cyanate transporter-like MFS transporter